MNRPDAPVLIRRGAEADVEGVRDLLRITWHDTYDALIGAERVTAVSRRWHTPAALRHELAAPATCFLVADAGGGIVGHILADARRPPLLTVTRLYVHPGWQRRGIGSRLLEAAIAAHPECDTLSLGVDAGNRKGLAFYRKHGFVVHGEGVNDGMRELMMEKSLR